MLTTFHHNVVNIVGISGVEFLKDGNGNPYDGSGPTGCVIYAVFSLWEDWPEDKIPDRLTQLKMQHKSEDIQAYILTAGAYREVK